jgi:peptidoglycan hydrolase-like protein with peptidoglycan-binding domain
MRKILIAGVFGVLASGSASAMDRWSIAGIQIALNDHGFNAGDADGSIGPATRKAMRGFAEKFGIDATPDAVLTFMVRMSIKSRTQITDQASLDMIKMGVSKGLRDPDSAKIRDVYTAPYPGGKYICGEVNGKNAYGGYAGYSAFLGMEIMGSLALISIDDSSSAFSQATCMTAFTVQ